MDGLKVSIGGQGDAPAAEEAAVAAPAEATGDNDSPFEVVITGARDATVKDARGRTIKVRMLSPVDKLRLYQAAGAANAENGPFMGFAFLASSVTAVEGSPHTFSLLPQKQIQIETRLDALGDDGLEAVGAAIVKLAKSGKEVAAAAKNLSA